MNHSDFSTFNISKDRYPWEQFSPDELTSSKLEMQLFICMEVQPVALTVHSTKG